MSQTPINVSYSLEDILLQINGNLNFSDFKRESLVSIESLKGNIKTLDVEVKGINKRLDSQEFINGSVAIGLIVAFLTGIVKLFFPNLLTHIPHFKM